MIDTTGTITADIQLLTSFHQLTRTYPRYIFSCVEVSVCFCLSVCLSVCPKNTQNIVRLSAISAPEPLLVTSFSQPVHQSVCPSVSQSVSQSISQSVNHYFAYSDKHHPTPTLTCPLSSIKLLVNLSLSKDTICFIHCAPVHEESG